MKNEDRDIYLRMFNGGPLPARLEQVHNAVADRVRVVGGGNRVLSFDSMAIIAMLAEKAPAPTQVTSGETPVVRRRGRPPKNLTRTFP